MSENTNTNTNTTGNYHSETDRRRYPSLPGRAYQTAGCHDGGQVVLPS